MNKEATLGFVVLFSALSIQSCHDFGDTPPPPPRIILGVSIDGIHLGYTRSQVDKAWAGLTISSGWMDGIERSWRVYYYHRAPGATPSSMVWFIETPETEWGPVDLVTATSGYEGRTQEGIGIGSRRHEVQRIIGLPAKTVTVDGANGGWDDFYCINRTRMLFRYDRDTVRSIALGPLMADTISPTCD